MDRPDWDTYFITQCFLIAQRSIDSSTKHGSLAVDKDHTVLALGFNSPPRGCCDEEIPLTRPEKYEYFIHAERAMINNAAKCGTTLDNSTVYITGHPCIHCMKDLISIGAKKVIYGPVQSNCLTEEMKISMNLILKDQSIILEAYKYPTKIRNLLDKTITYFNQKA